MNPREDQINLKIYTKTIHIITFSKGTLYNLTWNKIKILGLLIFQRFWKIIETYGSPKKAEVLESGWEKKENLQLMNSR